jgi:outer membrane lipoprotein-sorting protein
MERSRLPRNDAGTRLRLIPGLLVIAALHGLSGVSAVLAGDDLVALMKVLARGGASHVSFVEEKHLEMLDVPLVQEGQLSFTPPDRFERVVEGIGGGRFVIDGQYVLQEQGDSRRKLNLEQLPILKAFAASFGATLRGDLETLEKYYVVKYAGSQKAWLLELIPRDPGLQGFVTQIVLRGRDGHVDSMDIHESNGDWSRMKLLHE